MISAYKQPDLDAQVDEALATLFLRYEIPLAADCSNWHAYARALAEALIKDYAPGLAPVGLPDDDKWIWKLAAGLMMEFFPEFQLEMSGAAPAKHAAYKGHEPVFFKAVVAVQQAARLSEERACRLLAIWPKFVLLLDKWDREGRQQIPDELMRLCRDVLTEAKAPNEHKLRARIERLLPSLLQGGVKAACAAFAQQVLDHARGNTGIDLPRRLKEAKRRLNIKNAPLLAQMPARQAQSFKGADYLHMRISQSLARLPVDADRKARIASLSRQTAKPTGFIDIVDGKVKVTGAVVGPAFEIPDCRDTASARRWVERADDRVAYATTAYKQAAELVELKAARLAVAPTAAYEQAAAKGALEAARLAKAVAGAELASAQVEQEQAQACLQALESAAREKAPA